MFDEHKEYISVVITLHRDEYEIQKANGDSRKPFLNGHTI